MLKSSIVLNANEWNDFYPLLKQLKITYSRHNYTKDKMLILCECDEKAQRKIDEKINELVNK